MVFLYGHTKIDLVSRDVLQVPKFQQQLVVITAHSSIVAITILSAATMECFKELTTGWVVACTTHGNMIHINVEGKDKPVFTLTLESQVFHPSNSVFFSP